MMYYFNHFDSDCKDLVITQLQTVLTTPDLANDRERFEVLDLDAQTLYQEITYTYKLLYKAYQEQTQNIGELAFECIWKMIRYSSIKEEARKLWNHIQSHPKFINNLTPCLDDPAFIKILGVCSEWPGMRVMHDWTPDFNLTRETWLPHNHPPLTEEDTNA